MKKSKILLILLFPELFTGCSWTTDQLGPNDYEISGYFDFTLKGSVVLDGLEQQAADYCKTLGKSYVPDIYYRTDVNREFNYSAQRAAAKIRFRCVLPSEKHTLPTE